MKLKVINNPYFYLILAILIYSVVLIYFSLWKLNHGLYDNLDLAIFNNTLFNLTSGHGFSNAIHPPSYLGDHFELILILISPLYYFYRQPVTLLILQTFIIALTAWPIFIIAKKYLHQTIALLLALLWLLNPVVHNINIFEVHFLPLAVFFLFWAFYFYQCQKFKTFLLFIVLSLLIREDIALIVFCFSLLALIDKRQLKWKLTPAILGLFWFILAQIVIALNSATSSYKFISYYDWLGTAGPLDYLRHFLSYGNLIFVLGILFPLVFLPLLKPKYLLFLLPPLGIFLFTKQGGNQILWQTHYGGFFIWPLFISLIFVLANSGQQKLLLLMKRNQTLVLMIVVAASIYGIFLFSPLPYLFRNRDNFINIAETTRIIEPAANVAASYSLLSSLSSRNNLQSLAYASVGRGQFGLTTYQISPTTDYLAINWPDMLKAQAHYQSQYRELASPLIIAQNMQSILKYFEPVNYRQGVMILKRITATLPLSTLEKSGLADQKLSVVDYQSTRINNIDFINLTLNIPANFQKKLYINVENTKIPLGYNLFDLTQLETNKQLSMLIPIDDLKKQPVIKIVGWDKGNIFLNETRSIGLNIQAEQVLLTWEYPIN